MRVVFDSNAFGGDSFPLLEASPMLRLCRTGRISPIYSPVFMDELIAVYGIDGKREDLLTRWVPFIQRTALRICETGPKIRHRELVQGQGLKTNIYMRPRDQRRAFEALRTMAPDGTAPFWRGIAANQVAARESRQAAAKRYRELREKYKEQRVGVTWYEYSTNVSNIEDIGRRLLDVSKLAYDSGWKEFAGFVPVGNAIIGQLVARWAQNKSSYPYFTQAVVNFAYFLYYASERDERFDVNGANDLEILWYLVNADIVVSNERRFLKQAFNDIWKPKGRELLSVRDFVDRIDKLDS